MVTSIFRDPHKPYARRSRKRRFLHARRPDNLSLKGWLYIVLIVGSGDLHHYMHTVLQESLQHGPRYVANMLQENLQKSPKLEYSIFCYEAEVLGNQKYMSKPGFDGVSAL